MAAQGRQDGYPTLQPPPAPPRRRSPVDNAMMASSGTCTANTQPPIPKRRTTLQPQNQPAEGTDFVGDGSNSDICNSDEAIFNSRSGLMKTNSLFTGDSVLAEYTSDDIQRPLSVQVPSGSGFMADLQGIDFSSCLQRSLSGTKGSLSSSQNYLSSSLEDLVSKPKEAVYPDISGAFRELRSETVTKDLTKTPHNYAPPSQMFSNYVTGGGVGYGWNPSLLDAQAKSPFGPLSNLMPPPGSGPTPASGQIPLGFSAFQASGGYSGNGITVQGYPGNLSGLPSTNVLGRTAQGNPFHGGAFGEQGMNENSSSDILFPQIPSGLTRAASWNDIHDYSQASRNSSNGVSTIDGCLSQPQHQQQQQMEDAGLNDNLIQLQEGPPEHEYLSLDFFDPLYERGRKQSISVQEQNGVLNYSMGEAFSGFYQGKEPKPTVQKHCRRLSHEIWGVSTSQQHDSKAQKECGGAGSYGGILGFEAFTLEMFGTSDEEFLQSDNILTSSRVEPISQQSQRRPERPVSRVRTSEQTSRYEKLRKRTFIDPESDAFCQMVADLKKKYTSKDEKSNLGYLMSPVHTNHTPSTQIKVVIHVPFDIDPVSFTCDTNTHVEHVISQVLYSASPTHGRHHTADDYVLKVYDRTEYLSNDQPLSKFEYIHHCMKLDQDVAFEMVTREQVIRPFIRTVDDDAQMLYFPREYIKTDEEAVSKESLDMLLENFYGAVDQLTDRVMLSQTDNHLVQGVRQTVRAICAALANIETIDIVKSFDRLERVVTDMVSPQNRASKIMGGSNANTDADTIDAINVAIRCSFVEELQEVVDQVVAAVRQLVRMYCQTYHTEFFLGCSVDIPHDQTEVTSIRDSFIVHIATAHRLPESVQTQFDEFKVVCTLYHGTHRLHADGVTSCQPLNTEGLCQRVVWDEWLQFNLPLCKLPREMRLCMTLCGIRLSQGESKTADKSNQGSDTSVKEKIIMPIGAAAIQLYSQRGHLLQGKHLVPLTMGIAADPTMPSCKTLLPDSVLLQVNLPDFEKTIYFPPVVKMAPIPGKSFDQLMPEIRHSITDILEKDYTASLTAEEMEMVWRYRHYLYSKPRVLPRILQAKAHHGWDCNSLVDLTSLLQAWPTLHPTQAFELLLPQYADLIVREFAVDSLARLPADELVHFLPQLIQALKFESYHNSPLARLLLETSFKSIRFAHHFFWLLKGVAGQDATFKRRYELMFVALASVAGDTLYQEFHKQEDLVKILTSLAEKVKNAKDKDKILKADLQEVFEFLEGKGRILLPYNPSIEVTGIDMKSCSYFTSNAFPLKLVFLNSNPKADPVYAMFKVGDDLRQDMLTLQIIRIMDMLWLQEGLDLKMVTFSCLATGPKRGVVELITESETLRKIQVFSGVTGSFKDRTIKEWLQKHNPTELEYNKAVDNFMLSCAGYCVATYVLGIGDRHNDNIMLKQSGHMFHIDFSKFLGDVQMFGNFKRDRVPFVLTSDMAYVINDGGRQGNRFQHFIDICCQAFNILRQHGDLFRNLFLLMARSGIPGVTEQAVTYVQKALLPGLTNAQASAMFTRMIEESLKSVFTQFNFFIHNLAQLKFSSHSEGALLSFVPKTYSLQTDGPMNKVEVHSFQKRYTPERHYIFILRVEREGQRVPTYVFRHFSEFVEFRDKLAAMFPLVTWTNFSTRVVIGRSSIRTVAESRKVEIDALLKELFSKATEISQCDLVYTFFHPLLRDEQEADQAKLGVRKLKENTPVLITPPTGGNTGIQGEMKLSIQYRHEALQVMVMHVRNLARGSELPSPYVKTYLLPDPDKQTKRKTKTIKNTVHPTFNEVLQYKMKEGELRHRILQVTVWDHVLGENNFLGAVYIKLRDLDLYTETVKWYPLQKLQQPTL